jgi:hypothetical protein
MAVVKLLLFSRVAAVALVVFATLWVLFWRTNRQSRHSHFFFDPQDSFRANPDNPALPKSAETATFEPFLKHYIGVTQLLVTVAAASIAFGGGSHVPGAPIVNDAKLLLAWSIFYGVTFCAVLLWRYDDYAQNMTSYTLPWYSTIFALGFSSLVCFILGYFFWGWELL